jgi:hypothetical protein
MTSSPAARLSLRKDTPPAIRVGPTDRMFIAGMTKTGKSTFASAIASRWDRSLVYDPNVDDVAILPNSSVVYGVKAALAALPGRVVYRPSGPEMRDPGHFFGILCKRVFELGGHGIVVHELADFGASDREVDGRIVRIWRAGRHRFIPCIGVTQRPVNVARVFKSEAAILAAFHLVDPDDRRTMAGYMGPAVALEPVGNDHSFWYRDASLELWRMPALSIR